MNKKSMYALYGAIAALVIGLGVAVFWVLTYSSGQGEVAEVPEKTKTVKTVRTVEKTFEPKVVDNEAPKSEPTKQEVAPQVPAGPPPPPPLPKEAQAIRDALNQCVDNLKLEKINHYKVKAGYLAARKQALASRHDEFLGKNAREWANDEFAAAGKRMTEELQKRFVINEYGLLEGDEGERHNYEYLDRMDVVPEVNFERWSLFYKQKANNKKNIRIYLRGKEKVIEVVKAKLNGALPKDTGYLIKILDKKLPYDDKPGIKFVLDCRIWHSYKRMKNDKMVKVVECGVKVSEYHGDNTWHDLEVLATGTIPQDTKPTWPEAYDDKALALFKAKSLPKLVLNPKAPKVIKILSGGVINIKNAELLFAKSGTQFYAQMDALTKTAGRFKGKDDLAAFIVKWNLTKYSKWVMTHVKGQKVGETLQRALRQNPPFPGNYELLQEMLKTQNWEFAAMMLASYPQALFFRELVEPYAIKSQKGREMSGVMGAYCSSFSSYSGRTHNLYSLTPLIAKCPTTEPGSTIIREWQLWKGEFDDPDYQAVLSAGLAHPDEMVRYQTYDAYWRRFSRFRENDCYVALVKASKSETAKHAQYRLKEFMGWAEPLKAGLDDIRKWSDWKGAWDDPKYQAALAKALAHDSSGVRTEAYEICWKRFQASKEEAAFKILENALKTEETSYSLDLLRKIVPKARRMMKDKQK